RGDGGPWEVYLRHDGEWKHIVDETADVRGGTWLDGQLALMSFADAPRGKLLTVSPKGETGVLLGQRYGALQRVAAIKDGFLLVRSWGTHWWVEQYTAEGGFVRRLALPDEGIGIGAISSSAGSSKALIAWSGWTTPS